MKEFDVWNLGYALAKVKEGDPFIEHFRSIAITLYSFLEEKGLLNKKLLENPEFIPDDFVISTTDLTEDGYKFVMDGSVDRWLNSVDDITKPMNRRSLERSFKKLFGK